MQCKNLMTLQTEVQDHFSKLARQIASLNLAEPLSEAFDECRLSVLELIESENEQRSKLEQ